MDFSGVSKDYDITKAIGYVVAEMKDMGFWANKPEFMADYTEAITDPVAFIIKHMTDKKDGGNIMKPWSFVKASLILQQLREGVHCYIGMGFGKDCKTSCAQMGAFMVSDRLLLEACGFSEGDVADAYERVLAQCILLGIRNLTRNDIKKPFMAVLYGVAKTGLMSKKTILDACWNKLYANLDEEHHEEVASKLYKAITEGFGAPLNRLRNKIKQAGMHYPAAGEEGICKYASEVKYYLPDLFEVKMDYRVSIDLEGERVFGKNAIDVHVQGNSIDQVFTDMKFKTKTKDLESQSRTGFVNLVQAVDGLLARLIIVNLQELGATHVTSVHDCFRVTIHDVELLDEAIKASYLELFGTTHNVESRNLPLGTDICELYFQGTHKVTKDEWLFDTKMERMFYGKSKLRRLMEIGGKDLRECINSLGVMKYFDK